MKTILFTSCYLDGKDSQGNDRLERTQRYLQYYGDIKESLGLNDIKLLVNGSKITPAIFNPDKNIYFESLPNLEHGRPNFPFDYRHCWRTFWHLKTLIEQGYKKIISIDTDTFVISKQLAAYIKDLEKGYTTFWSRKYQFPTAELTILCQDKFERILKFCETPIEEKYGKLMEQNLPFTQVNVEYNCDRFGETNMPVDANMDMYSQAGPLFKPELR